MQINRLFQIVYILLSKKITTAKELSGRFEVSVRTIYRDVETLSAAGIPIYTTKGKGGGISLLDNFVLNKSLLNESEQNDILNALQSFRLVNQANDTQVFSKLSTLFNKNAANWIEADFSDWSGNSNNLFTQIKSAILGQKIIIFDYYGSNSAKSTRQVQPLQLWLKHKSWYLKGFCIEKQDYRLFKLSRIKHMIITENLHNHTLDTTLDLWQIDQRQAPTTTIKLWINASQAYRIYDEFDEDEIFLSSDGNFIITVSFPEDEWVYNMILSFGHFAKVIEPPHIKEIIIHRLAQALECYK